MRYGQEEADMYERILIPLDGSELAESSLAFVQTIGTGCNVKKIILFGVLDDTSLQFNFLKTVLGDHKIKEAQEENRSWLNDYLIKIADGFKEKGLIASAVVEKGNAAEKILDYAGSKGIDLIIMSTHGSSGKKRFAFGSVTKKVLHNSQVPVIMIPPKSGR
jgi:nucleotide-binding universal stress UspA family protein